MFALRIEFLTGTYTATWKGEAEWPPHPARVYSSLIALAHELHPDNPDKYLDAIHQLSSLDAPSLFIPENGESVTSTGYTLQGADLGYRFPKPPSSVDLYKQVELSHNYTSGIQDAYYIIWDQSLPDKSIELLQELVEEVWYLGKQRSHVQMQIVDSEIPCPTLYPVARKTDIALRTGGKRYVKETLNQYAMQQQYMADNGVTEGEIRTPSISEMTYYASTPDSKALAHSGEWVTLSLDRRLIDAEAYSLIRAFRSTLLAQATRAESPYISGHDIASNLQIRYNHIAFIPLIHRGTIYGIGIWLPYVSGVDVTKEKHRLFSYLGNIINKRIPVYKDVLVEDAEGSSLKTLNPSLAYTKAHTRFETITPVLLPRAINGLIRRQGPSESSLEKVRSILAGDLAQQGIDCAFAFATDKARMHASPAKEYGPITYKERPHQQLPLLHMTIEFDQPISGLLSVGAGRYLGMGLLKGVAHA